MPVTAMVQWTVPGTRASRPVVIASATSALTAPWVSIKVLGTPSSSVVASLLYVTTPRSYQWLEPARSVQVAAMRPQDTAVSGR